MRRTDPSRRTLVLALATLGACGSEEGQVTIAFTWSDPPPADSEGFTVEAQVVARSGQVTPALPVPLSAGVRLAVERVPYGSALVLEIRIVQDGPPSRLAYVGSSEPFDFAPGDDRRVDVELALAYAPLESVGPTRALTVTNAVQGRVKTSALELGLTARGVERIELAQDAAFTQGLAERLAADHQAGPPGLDGFASYAVPYDLNAVLPACSRKLGGDPASCEGLRQVYARGLQGRFVGAVASATVTLDTTPVQILEAAVELLPPLGSAVDRPTSAAPGTAVVVSVLFDEPIDSSRSPPTMVGERGMQTLSFALEDAAETSARFRATLGATPIDGGIYTPRITVQDRAGNRTDRATFTEPQIVIDAAIADLVVDQDAVSYLRAPEGRGEPESLGAFTLPAGSYFALAPADPLEPAAALPAGTFRLADREPLSGIRVYGADQQSLLRTIRPGGSGVWEREALRLPEGSDRVFVTGFDAAGNESSPVLITRGWYVATAAPNRAGVSPHRVATAAGDARPRSFLEDVGVSARLGAADGEGLIRAAEARWIERATVGGPVGALSHGLAFDEARGRLVLYGGTRLSNPWEWDGTRWRPIAALTDAPPHQKFFGMVFDAARGRTVIFGGFSAGRDKVDETWEWDGARWWNVTPEGPSPSARSDIELVYDANRGRVVLFGGRDEMPAYLDDTWTWNGKQWSELIPDGARPPPRGRHGLAYDAHRDRVVLFGGWNDDSDQLGDTWELDGNDWDRIIPETSPPGRFDPAMAYDSARKRVVLFGGGGDQVNRPGTWEWDGSNWSLATLASPEPRNSNDLAYDSVRDAVINFGGVAETGLPTDLSAWNGSSWTMLHSNETVRPAPRRGASMVFDARSQRLVVFGGGVYTVETDTFELNDDLWSWTGEAWELTETSTGPAARWFHAMAYDDAREEIVLFGGSDEDVDRLADFGDTWTWDGAAWRQRPTPAGLGPRAVPAMAYDAVREKVILFGGRDPEDELSSETWLWDGTEWTLAAVDGPSPRQGAALAYDPIGERVVLFGGADGPGPSNTLSDTWVWDGHDWTERRRSGFGAWPPARSNAGLTFDTTRGRLVLHGGYGPGGLLFDTWERTGTTWTEITPSGGSPPPGQNASLGHDPVRGVTLLFGTLGQERSNQTWELTAPTRPTIQFAPRIPGDIDRSAVRDLRVRAQCGGAFEAASGRAFGAVLSGWQTTGSEVGWVELAENDGDLPDPSMPTAGTALDYATARGAEAIARSFLVVRDRRMYFQCRSAEASVRTDQPAHVGADYFEVRVGYMVSR